MGGEGGAVPAGGGLERVDAALRELAGRGFSGVALVTRGGDVAYEGCFGLANRADGVPVRPATRFGLASFTKMFTAVAVADLVRAGTLGFDTPVVEVLPAELRPATLRPDVTVHDLLCHGSGIADYFEEQDEDADYGALWVDRPAYRMLRPADFLPLFGDRPPLRPPGQRFQYSNAGYIVLGLVIERLTGRPYTEVVTERVLRPAGMTASGFFHLDEARPDIATGYLPPREPGGPWRSNVYAVPVVGGADGGAFATAGDIDRFLRRYDDGTLLGDLRETMLEPRWTVDGDLRIGYGVFGRGEGRSYRFGHGGGDPGCQMLAHRFPALDATVVVLTNAEDAHCGAARDILVDAVLATT